MMGLTAKRHHEEVTDRVTTGLIAYGSPKIQHQLPGSYGNSFFKIQNLMSVPIMNSLLVVFLEYLLSVALLQMYSS